MIEATKALPTSSEKSSEVPVVVAVMATGGGRLRLRREALALSIDDVAASLKIPSKKIKALEAEDWDALPTGPYLRGFLRSYAKILRMDAADLIEEVDASLMQSRSPDTILRMPQSFDTPLPKAPVDAGDWRRGRRLIYLGFGVLLVIGLLIWSGTQSFSILRSRLVQATSQSIEQPVVTAESPVDTTSGTPVSGPVAASTTSLENPVGLPDIQASGVAAHVPAGTETASLSTVPAVVAGQLLEFDFQGKSWVLVRQSDGKVLMSQMNAANTHASIEGQAPLDLIIGNANQVKLQYRGQTVDLTSATRYNVARLTLP